MSALSGRLTAPPLQALLADAMLAGEWVLDQHRSSIRLRSRVLGGVIRVNGVFRDVRGYGIISPDGAVSGTVTVTTASIDTKNARRDAHLRSADFFGSENNPDITFTADGIRLSGQGVVVTGALAVRDRTKALSFTAEASVRDASEICLDAEARVNRADFGLTWNLLGMVSMNSIITVHAVFSRQ